LLLPHCHVSDITANPRRVATPFARCFPLSFHSPSRRLGGRIFIQYLGLSRRRPWHRRRPPDIIRRSVGLPRRRRRLCEQQQTGTDRRGDGSRGCVRSWLFRMISAAGRWSFVPTYHHHHRGHPQAWTGGTCPPLEMLKCVFVLQKNRQFIANTSSPEAFSHCRISKSSWQASVCII